MTNFLVVIIFFQFVIILTLVLNNRSLVRALSAFELHLGGVDRLMTRFIVTSPCMSADWAQQWVSDRIQAGLPE